MAGEPFPHPTGMPSFWRTELGPLDRHRTTPDLPLASDIVVIGAGFSAASFLTHFIAESVQPLPSIIVLEARQISSGATGRNGGHCKPDNYYAISRHAENYGIDAARELAAFEMDNLKAVSEYVSKERVDCDMVVTRAMDVQLNDIIKRDVRRAYTSLQKSSFHPLKETFEIPEPHAEKITGVKGAKSAYSYTSGHLWPYKLVHHMLTNALQQGVNLQTETPVTRVSKERDSEGYWTIFTDRGNIKSKTIIVTTNAYTSAILQEYKEKIIPYKATACRIACPPGRAPLLTNSYALRFAGYDFDYLIPRPDGSIVVGGARSEYLANLDDWYGNVDDSTLIERAKKYFDRYMQRHFHGWENSEAAVSHIWTGIMGYSSDRLPRVGEIPKRPGMYIMGGFTGHGMPQIFLTSKGLVKIVKDKLPFSHSRIPRIFEESEARMSNTKNEVLDLWKMAQPRANL